MRKILFGIAFITICLITGCEKAITEDYSLPEMKAFYQESITLPSVTTDSVNRFSVKVNDFVEVNPEALDDPLYPKIMSNIKTATLRITITINDEWDGETHINF